MPEEKNNAISVQVDDLGTLAELKAMQEAAIGASEAVDEESHSQEVAKHRIYSDSKYDKPKYTAMKDGIGFAPKGNIIMLSAEKKHGKTFVLAQIAALMSGGIEEGNFYLNGLYRENNPYKIGYFDTEMDMYDSQLTLKRILYMGKIQQDQERQRVFFYNLREMGSEQRAKFIMNETRKEKFDVIFVDGVRDLLNDFNDIDESSKLVSNLMNLSSDCDCAIWCVLHVNPNTEKMRGHLGTELGNKASDIFHVTKHKDNTSNENLYTVKHKDSRHRDIPEWTFRIDNEVSRLGIPELVGFSAEKAKIAITSETEDEDFLKATFEEILKGRTANTRELIDDLKKKKSIGYAKAKRFIEKALEYSIILSVNKGNQVVYCLMVNQEPELPF